MADLMRRAGYIRDDGSVGLKSFARAVSDASGPRGLATPYTHTYVRRWLDGTVPRDTETRDAIARALERRLGRRVGWDELGFAAERTVPVETGLGYPTSLDDGVGALAALLQADADNLRPIVISDPNVSA